MLLHLADDICGCLQHEQQVLTQESQPLWHVLLVHHTVMASLILMDDGTQSHDCLALSQILAELLDICSMVLGQQPLAGSGHNGAAQKSEGWSHDGWAAGQQDPQQKDIPPWVLP